MSTETYKTLTLNLLGTPEITIDDQPVTGFVSKKARAALFYLAVTRQTQSREKLAAFLWPREPDSVGRTNVRDLVRNLRKTVGPYLDITRSTMALKPQAPIILDVHMLETAVATSPPNPNQLIQAVDYYRGDFLEGFFVDNSPPFEQWVFSQNERLRELLIQGLQWLIDHTLNQRNISTGLRLTRQLLDIEPWHEPVYQQRMRLYAYNQQREAALKVYMACRDMLAQAFGIEPSPETEALYQRLLAETDTTTSYHNLPRQLTPFIGRQEDIHQLRSKVLDKQYPLVTITGEGGMGKTRVALMLAQQIVYDFTDGVWFVPLADIQPGPEDAKAEEQIATAVVTALNLIPAQQHIKQQLLDHLRNRKLLLILDNFEHLLPHRSFIHSLLQTCPHLHLLITSRARLHFQAEFVYRLSGLPLPHAVTDLTEMAQWASVQLFLERASRVYPPFRLTAQNALHVQQICHLVAGLPLGIELAAALVEGPTCHEIMAQVEATLLKAQLYDIPPRHRSLWAVFDYSWQLLSANLQTILAQCAIFTGGFTIAAATAVTQATPHQLQALHYQSLLQQTKPQRFDMHPLLQQFAAAKLAQQPSQQQALQNHYTYYLQTRYGDFSAIWNTPMPNVQADTANIRQAWFNAIQAHAFAFLAAQANSLIIFMDRLDRLPEALTLIQAGLEQLAATGLTPQPKDEWYHLLLIEKAGLLAMLGHYEEAYQAAEQVQQKTTSPTLLSIAYRWQGQSLWSRGRTAEADTYLQQAYALKAHFPQVYLGTLLNNMGALAWQQGQSDKARMYLEEGLIYAEKANNIPSKLFVLNSLGLIAQYHGYPYEAFGYYDTMLREAKAIDYLSGKIYALVNIGFIHIHLGQFEQVEPYLEEALTGSRRMGDRQLEGEVFLYRTHLYNFKGTYEQAATAGETAATIFQQLESTLSLALAQRATAEAYLGQQQWSQAHTWYQQALAIWQELALPEGMVETLAGLACLAYQQNQHEQAGQWLNQVLTLLPDIFPHHEAISDLMSVYGRCIYLLQAFNDPRAASLQQEAQHILHKQSQHIPDPAVRQQFLYNIPSHHTIMQLTAPVKG